MVNTCIGSNLGGVPPQDGLPTYKEATLVTNQWELGVPPPPPPLGEVMGDMGLEEVEVYVARRHNTVP